ncbi:MAG: MBL fold metallo-hydrolase [Vulcanimicrobiota bacterium]
MLAIQFLGAAGTVTGSKYSITYGNRHFMVDCGMFQGEPEVTERNFQEWPVAARDYEALFLTHAHIDHSGAIPRLVADGFDGPILCTEPTIELCELLLPDSAKIMRLEGIPLYSEEHAATALELMEGCNYYKQYELTPGVGVTFFDAGHILGSAWLELEFDPLPDWPRQQPVRVVFSGDLGRGLGPMLAAPDRPERADFLILESTYGGRLHSRVGAAGQLEAAVEQTRRRRSTLVIPAFAVQRSQDIAYLFETLEVGNVALYIDSPMAARAIRVFERFPDYLSTRAGQLLNQYDRLLRYPHLRICETTEQSRSILNHRPPRVIVSASGMAEGGRVLHHLRHHLPDARSKILLAGYQCEGTRGWQLQCGDPYLDIDGRSIPVRAEVESLDGLSGHADYAEIGQWLSELEEPPQTTFLVHGDEESLTAQQERLSRQGWRVEVPEHRQRFVLIT